MRMYDIIQKKRDGGVLTEQEIQWFISSYVKGEIPDYQVAALCMAIGLTINGYMGSIVLTEFNIIGKLCISKKGNPGETNWLTGDEYKQVVEKGVEGVEGFYCHSLSHYQSVGYTENDEQRHEVYIRCISNDYFRNAIERIGNMILEGKDSIGEG